DPPGPRVGLLTARRFIGANADLLAERSAAAGVATAAAAFRRGPSGRLALPFAFALPRRLRRELCLGLQPGVGLVTGDRAPLQIELVGPSCDLVLPRLRAGARAIGLRHGIPPGSER